MKRPILTILLSLVHGELLAAYMSNTGQSIIFLILVVAVLAYGIVKKKYFFALLYAIFFAVGFFNMYNVKELHMDMEKISRGSDVSIEGSIIEAENREYGSELIIRVKDFKCRVSFDEYISEDIYGLIGNNVKIKGKKEDFQTPSNPGGFDEREYNYSNNIVLKVKGREIEVTDNRVNEFKILSLYIKENLNSILEKLAPKREAGVFMAILYGEKKNLDSELKELYADGGISHILVISGLHISIVGMGIYKIAGKYMTSKWAGIFSTLFMIAYGVLAGGSVSSVRAIIMFFINLLSKLTGYEYDMKNSVCIAGVLLLFDNPYYIYNVSFLLSFGAVSAVAFMAPYVIKYVKAESKIIKSLILSISINIVNAPIVANAYYEASLYGMFINLLIIPLMTVVTASGFVGIAVGIVWTDGGKIVIGVGVAILRLYEWICGMTLKLPFSRIVTGHFDFWDMLIFYGMTCIFLVIIFVITQFNKNKKKIICYAAVSVAALFLHYIIYTSRIEENKITFLDVGQGESSVFVSGNGDVFLFDAGSSSVKDAGKYRILPFLKYSGIKEIDYVVLSHSDNDHINAMEEIMEDRVVNVKNIIIPYGDNGFDELTRLAEEKNINVIVADDRTKIEGECVKIEFINPMKDGMEAYEDVNEGSLVAIIDSDNKKIIMTGDIGEKTEKLLVESGKLKDVDILKVAHHGSRYSSSLEMLDVIRPDIAVISCGENNSYGHPHSETLERLEKIGSKVFITKEAGAITIDVVNETEIYVYKR